MAVYEQLKRNAYIFSVMNILRKRGIQCYPISVIDASCSEPVKIHRMAFMRIRYYLN